MITITEDYCDYGIAKKLNQKGFNPNWISGAKPTIQMAQKFLRVVYNLNIIVFHSTAQWCYAIHDMKNPKLCVDAKDGFETYEQAMNLALNTALDAIEFIDGVHKFNADIVDNRRKE